MAARYAAVVVAIVAFTPVAGCASSTGDEARAPLRVGFRESVQARVVGTARAGGRFRYTLDVGTDHGVGVGSVAREGERELEVVDAGPDWCVAEGRARFTGLIVLVGPAPGRR